MARRSARAPTLDSLLPPILDNLSSTPPNPYSAHQKALTTTARLVASKHHAIAIEICMNVSRELLKLGEAGSGVELAVRGLGIMGDSEVAVDDKSRASVTQLLALTPASGPWRKKLADAAIKWSANEGECPTGDPGLHQYIGELYYKDQQYPLAEQHLLSSGKRDAANLLAEMMFDWSGKGTHDPAPYAARGVLPFLAQTPPNVLPAQTFLNRFLSLLSPSCSILSTSFDKDISITSNPTLNFLQLAILTVQRAPAPGVSGVQARGTDGGVGREWEGLVNRYRRIGGNDGVLAQREVLEVLSQISASVFLIPQRGNQQNDMLQNLMGSLFGGGAGGAPARR